MALFGKIIISKARLKNIGGIVILEKKAWGQEGADRKKIAARIQAFPEGNIIATYKKEVVGYVSFEYVDEIKKNNSFSWSNITDNGMATKSHKKNGDFIYGINLSILPSKRFLNIGSLLMLEGLKNMIINNKKGAYIGSRIPDYNEYKKKNPKIRVDQYIKLKRKDGKFYDRGLRLYQSQGLQPIKALANYFPDLDSRNYGVLVFKKNIFYNWPFRTLIANFIVNLEKIYLKFH
ncbi:MAG: hypothetical protein GF332_01740 [Candidatus Moranbacteria bacterium]|nr:hypothetical protein [Candidatus Moranbacteria bacterium]